MTPPLMLPPEPYDRDFITEPGGAMKVKIDVTQDDIRKGRPAICAACPIALAAARVLPFIPHVTPWAIHVTDDPEYGGPFMRLPDEATAFIEAFDNGRPVTPFSFELDVPAELAPAVTS